MGIPHALSEHLTAATVRRRAKSKIHVIRRQPSMQQGQALLSLGHAIEYLIDSRLHRSDEAQAKSDTEASQILMRLSREVFAECREIVPIRRMLQRWLGGLFSSNW